MNKHCDKCYYCEMCRSDNVCDDYIPVDENAVDDEKDNLIEENRIAFRAEWFEYIEKCYE